MQRAETVARTVTVHKKEGGGLTVRCGDDIVGFVTRLEGGDEEMRGHFTRGPHYPTHAQLVTAASAAEREKGGMHVYSSVHDMRIDAEETLVIEADQVRFRPAGAFIVLRSGGLG
jgi:hypothetical protein